MNLYRVTSPSIGHESLVVKAKDTYEASQVARDVIEEGRWTTDKKYPLYVTELVQPENDGHGYCYPHVTVTKHT